MADLNQEIRDLDKTLKVNGDIYNINATHADAADIANLATEAKQLQKALTIKSLDLDGQEKTAETIDFTGESAASVSVISAESGGRFNAPIRVPNNINTDGIHDEAVLNYNDLTKVVLTEILNNSTVYEWDNEELSPAADSGTINGISIVTGREDARDAFIAFNNSEVLAGRGINRFLYISTAGADHGYIYYCIANKSVLRLAASHALRVSSPDGPSYSAEDIQTEFNNLYTGITSAGKAKVLSDYDTAGNLREKTAVQVYNELAQAAATQQSLSKIIDGSITVPKAQTAKVAESAQSITVYTSTGSKVSQYAATARVIISQNAPQPSDGNNGDIWIKYS